MDSSRPARKIATQRISPRRHVDIVGMEAGRRQYGVSGTPRWSRKFGGSYGLDQGRQSRPAHDFGGKVVPSAFFRVSNVDYAGSGRAA